MSLFVPSAASSSSLRRKMFFSTRTARLREVTRKKGLFLPRNVSERLTPLMIDLNQEDRRRHGVGRFGSTTMIRRNDASDSRFFTTMVPSYQRRNNEPNDLGRHKAASLQACRQFHCTQKTDIAPFLPEIVAFVFFVGGWVSYRTYHGKPLTPDESLELQERYRQQEAFLQQKNATRNRGFFVNTCERHRNTHTENGNKACSRGE